MDRLISLEPSNLVAIRVEGPSEKCSGEVTLRNVMYTMPVAFRLQALIKTRYSFKPQSGIIPPLSNLTVEIIYHLLPGSYLPESFPHSDDSFLLHSVVVPGAAIKETPSSFDSVPSDWFTTKKKQVFIDSGIKVMFVGSAVLAHLVQADSDVSMHGRTQKVSGSGSSSMDEIREVLERSDPSWNAVDSVDNNGETLLHLAIAQGRADLVQLLLEFNPDVEAKSRSAGTTALEAASAAGEALIVELLLARRAITERSENSMYGPIHLAAAGGHMEVLRLLLLKGCCVDGVSKDENTALHVAVEERRRDCVRLLLANGATPDLRNAEEGDTPLHIAARIGDEQVVKLLLQNGANKDIRNWGGKRAYDVAADHDHRRLFDALHLGDKLCTASRKGDVKSIQLLIKNGAAINGRDQNNWTALHRAAFKGKTEAARALIDMGIELDAKDDDGYTALHCGVESGNADIVELLVKRGADVELQTNKGMTPMEIALSLQYARIVRILIHGGATTTVRDDEDDVVLPRVAALAWNREGKSESLMKNKKKKKQRSRIRNLYSTDFDRPVALSSMV